MPFHFVDQPFRTGFSLSNFFEEVLDSEVEEVDLVTAWVKRSGVAAVSPVLTSLRGRGVRLRAVVGISLGGTSRQGLDDLLGHVDELFIYQHPGRTFHPKIYRAAASGSALTMVGSHNLTAGGVANNFEAGTFGRLNFGVEDERTYHADLLAYVDRLATDAAARPVDHEFLDTLLANDRYVLLDEETALHDTGDETGTRAKPSSPHLFARSDQELSEYLPPRSGRGANVASGGQSVETGFPNDAASNGTVIREDDDSSPTPVVQRRWFKVLGRIDAQQGTSANWNPSNTATLVEAGHPIHRETYFRDVMFNDLEWQLAVSRGGKEREVAELLVEVVTDDGTLGQYRLEVRHTPGYESDQSNRTTELQWGELASHMRAVDHVGDYLTLEQLSDGNFRVYLTTETPGPFKK